MGRPDKHTVDYFPFYVKDGKTLFILESKYGCKGTGFFANLMRFLCLTPDHHYCISGGRNSERLYFFSKLHCDEESGIDMINIMAETGKINKDLWLRGNIIVSEDLIKSLFEAYRKRENKTLTLDEIRTLYHLPAEEMKLPAEEIIFTGGIKPQRKEKKRKEKKYYEQEFIIFWDAYPLKIGKEKAADAWENRSGDRPPLEKILEAIKAQKIWRDNANGEFRPEWKHPSTWINQGCWADEVSIKQSKSSKERNPFKICTKCKKEYMETDVIEVGGIMYCPKCPEARRSFSHGNEKLKGLIDGI